MVCMHIKSEILGVLPLFFVCNLTNNRILVNYLKAQLNYIKHKDKK